MNISQRVSGRGSFTNGIASPPLLLMPVNNSRFWSHTTTIHHSCAQECTTNDKLRILVKAQDPPLEASGHAVTRTYIYTAARLF